MLGRKGPVSIVESSSWGFYLASLVQDVIGHVAGEAQEKGFLCRGGF